jgi:hypothetical protein
MRQPTSIKKRPSVSVKKPVPINKPFNEQPSAPPAPVPKPMVKKPPKPTMKATPTMFAKGGWIKDAIKKPGALREQLGVKKGEKIPKAKLAAAAKKGGKLGQRARLAITLGKMNKKK